MWIKGRWRVAHAALVHRWWVDQDSNHCWCCCSVTKKKCVFWMLHNQRRGGRCVGLCPSVSIDIQLVLNGTQLNHWAQFNKNHQGGPNAHFVLKEVEGITSINFLSWLVHPPNPEKNLLTTRFQGKRPHSRHWPKDSLSVHTSSVPDCHCLL